MALAMFLAVLLAISTASARVVPTTDIIVYVDPAGSDTTGDGSAAHPWATPQHAADELYDDYDLGCKYKATIQLAVAPPGSYNFYPGLNISGRLIGQCGTLRPLTTSPSLPPFVVGKYLPFTLQGDTTGTNPLGAFINPGNGGRPGGACISLSDGAALRVVGIACDTTSAGQDGFDIFNSFMDMSNVWFGNAGYPGTTYSNHVSVGFGGTLLITGPYGMSGSALAHINGAANSTVDFENNGDPSAPITVTINGALSFPAGFVLMDTASVLYAQIVHFSITGSVTGPTATVLRNAVVETGSGGTTAHSCNANYFPGNAAPVIQDNAVCR